MKTLTRRSSMTHDHRKCRHPATSENESEIMKAKPECYGTMFPDLSKVLSNTPREGKAFTLLVESSGFGITDRHSAVRMEQWDACTECPSYERCYDLSVAKLMLHQVAQGYGLARAL
jgi:hypothetical protein